MKLRHVAALALGCAYFIGWALVLGLLLANSGGGESHTPAFLLIAASQYSFNNFMSCLIFAWVAFTIPCVIVAVLVLYGTGK